MVKLPVEANKLSGWFALEYLREKDSIPHVLSKETLNSRAFMPEQWQGRIVMLEERKATHKREHGLSPGKAYIVVTAAPIVPITCKSN